MTHSHSNTGTAADEEIAACPTCNPDAKSVDCLAWELLVYWGLPLLARARRCIDALAEGQPVQRETLAMLGDDIADLIGHSVTDQPRAPELDRLTRDALPITSHLPGRRGTREFFEAATGRADAKPVDSPTGKSGEPAAPVEETPQARARRLDAEREEAGRAYRRAIQAADEAHRAIGGRP